jgi:hypothetical protein
VTRRARAALLVFPLGILLVCYAAICIRFHTLLPWHAQVHEDGHRSLGETIFYFEHALGELPIDIVLSSAVGGSAAAFFGALAEDSLRRLRRRALGFALAADAAIAIGACIDDGWRGAVTWLLQEHTREGVPYEFGAHWGYHLLSEAALILLAFALAGTIAGHVPRPHSSGWWLASCAVFVALTPVFGIGAAPFIDARFLGHQARETFTHALVTVPLALGVCLIAAPPSEKRWAWPRGAVLWAWAGAALLALYQGAGAILSGSSRLAQTHDPLKLICGHFFEHTLDYLVVAVHSLFFYAIAARSEAKARARG